MSYFREENNLKIDVFITRCSGGEVASKLQGFVILNNHRFRFTSVAFGRIGGHNVSIKLSNTSISKIKKMGVDPEELQLTVQRKLIEGDVNLPQNIEKPD